MFQRGDMVNMQRAERLILLPESAVFTAITGTLSHKNGGQPDPLHTGMFTKIKPSLGLEH